MKATSTVAQLMKSVLQSMDGKMAAKDVTIEQNGNVINGDSKIVHFSRDQHFVISKLPLICMPIIVEASTFCMVST